MERDDGAALVSKQQHSGFAQQMGCLSELQVNSMRVDAVIKMEEQKAVLYNNTVCELEAERKLKLERLEAFGRLLASEQQQASQLIEDISTIEQYAFCFKTRLAADRHEVPDFKEDLERRNRLARTVQRRAEGAIEALTRLGEQRVHHVLRAELDTDERPHLSQYLRSNHEIISTIRQLREQDAKKQQQSPSASPPANEACDISLHSLGEQLMSQLDHSHVNSDPNAPRFSELASVQLGRLGELADAVPVYANVREEHLAAAASMPYGEGDDGRSTGEEDVVDAIRFAMHGAPNDV